MTLQATSTVLLDTNIAIYSVIRGSEFHLAVRHRLEHLLRQGCKLCIAAQTIREMHAASLSARPYTYGRLFQPE